jgi:RNA polymerase-binding transcription factor DksA
LSAYVLPSTVPPIPPSALSAEQFHRLHDLLVAQWQDRVALIIELSLRLHDAAEPRENPAATSQAVRALAEAHRALADSEAAIERLQRREYGRCAACAAEVPFERLEASPETAMCARCASPA